MTTVAMPLLDGERNRIGQHRCDRYVVVATHDHGDRVSPGHQVVKSHLASRAVHDAWVPSWDRFSATEKWRRVLVQEVVQVVVIQLLRLGAWHKRGPDVVDADRDRPDPHRLIRGR